MDDCTSLGPLPIVKNWIVQTLEPGPKPWIVPFNNPKTFQQGIWMNCLQTGLEKNIKDTMRAVALRPYIGVAASGSLAPGQCAQSRTHSTCCGAEFTLCHGVHPVSAMMGQAATERN